MKWRSIRFINIKLKNLTKVGYSRKTSLIINVEIIVLESQTAIDLYIKG